MTIEASGGKRALYARFFKADLQMQTPVDRRHWAGKTSALSQSPSEEEYQAVATAYVDRCYEVGLEIIGLTDHNLGREDAETFHDALMSAIDAKAATEKWRPCVFPGFEVQANVGKGLHLLCLFNPGTPFSEVDDALTELGLARGSRFDGGKPQPLPVTQTLDSILNCIQEKYGGIVIAAHPDGPKGAMSDADLDRWLQASVITNPNLLCMELREGREAYITSQSKLGIVVRNDRGDWHRPHPIAIVSSSDCKRLSEGDGTGDESWIGKRHTWLKMSDRTIEGLRQAFLDHESRIAFGPQSPDEIAKHPRINRIRINGVDFLTNIDVWLSPNLTTFIGGGGTGKSTILEYCRAALQQPLSDTHTDVAMNHENIVATLGAGWVELTLSHGASVVRATASADGVEAVDTEEEPICNLAIQFPVMVLGQREVYAIAGSQKDVRSFVDRIDADRLRSMKHDEDELRARAIYLGERLDLAADINSRRSEIQGERNRLLADIRGAALGSDDGLTPEDILREIAAVRRIDDAIENRAESITKVAVEVAAPLDGVAVPDGSTHKEAILAYSDEASALLLDSAESLREVSRSLVELRDLHDDLPREFEIPQSWASSGEVDTAESSSVAVVDLLSRIAEFDRQIDELGATATTLTAEASTRPDVLAQLHAVWEEQVSTRQRISVELRDLVPETDTGDPFVEVSVVPFGNRTDLEGAIAKEVDDNRRFSSSDITELVEIVYSASPEAKNPTLLLCDWLRSLPSDLPDELAGFSDARISALRESFVLAAIRRLETSRPLDTVSVMLRRNDGSEAGTLDRGLSVGQKCTAILALALAEGTYPILIDQPEDEIDNEFIYQNLVPLLRRAKRKRQVILATHDPNLPVNGDAELIVALEARSASREAAHGMVKLLSEGQCIGSLDRRAVKLAVEEIMEGSEEAFLRRHVRYGF